MIIGVLAIQGDFAAHARALSHIGIEAVEVRRASDLGALEGLIIPGGESTTMLKFIEDENLAAPIIDLAKQGKPIFGTCAGAILLAQGVYNPAQASLRLIDIDIERNGYGRQADSFIAEIDTSIGDGQLEAVFIRAPRIKRVGVEIEVLGRLNGEAVLVRGGNVLAATFHPELTSDAGVHLLFVEMVRARQAQRR